VQYLFVIKGEIQKNLPHKTRARGVRFFCGFFLQTELADLITAGIRSNY
jgi:hypothetical protein